METPKTGFLATRPNYVIKHSEAPDKTFFISKSLNMGMPYLDTVFKFINRQFKCLN